MISRFALCLVASLLLVAAAQAGVVVHYNFENDLLDTGADGTVADNLAALGVAGETAATFQPGVVGQAVNVSRLAGEAAVLEAGDSDDLDLGTDWTVEAFVKPDFANVDLWDRFATKWFDGSTEFHWTFRYPTNGQDLFLNGGPAIDGGGTGTVPLNEWSHVAMTGDSTDAAAGIKLWQDGAVVGTAAWQAVTPGTGKFRIGNWKTSETLSQFSGLVDEFIIHDVPQDAAYMEGRAALLSEPPPVDPPVANPETGLVTFYEFEGDATQRLADTADNYTQSSSTAIDNLSIVGAVDFVDGPDGQVADFDGGYVIAAISPDVTLPATFTLEAWINPDNPTAVWQRLVLNWGAEHSYHFALKGGTVSLFIKEADGTIFEVAGGGSVVPGEWQHVAAVLNETSMTGNVYLNGALVGSGAFDGTLATTLTEGMGLGDSAATPGEPGMQYDGLIDDVAIWNVALSPQQIESHFNHGYGLTEVPEPGTIVLLAAGAFGLLVARRRRK
ncbi:MAG: PEP-CTERM sorting domain-containing protein [Candidatus Nealsonbacteria bacterium]|nr:PEP-CTERM sorting domain-containing protein [Candidatus Nealsonbacteria bacterium]